MIALPTLPLAGLASVRSGRPRYHALGKPTHPWRSVCGVRLVGVYSRPYQPGDPRACPACRRVLGRLP